ncbi:MAG: hypothetical protein IJ105_03570, partial [Bacilli bacterium]|nr:hypothetical protein [Bacilli bacterium]
SSIISVFAANYLYSSSEVSFDNSSSGISSDNVQGAIDELYQNASDYSSLESRIGVLEGRWQNSPESYFEKSGTDEWLRIKNSNSSGSRGVVIRDSSSVNRGLFYYSPSKDTTVLDARDSSGSSGKGTLDLRGNPVMVNGKEVGKQVKIETVLASTNYTPSTSYKKVGSFSCVTGSIILIDARWAGQSVTGVKITLSSNSNVIDQLIEGMNSYSGVFYCADGNNYDINVKNGAAGGTNRVEAKRLSFY